MVHPAHTYLIYLLSERAVGYKSIYHRVINQVGLGELYIMMLVEVIVDFW